MAILKRKDFIRRLSRASGITMGDLNIVFDHIISEMERIVKDGDTLKFKRFGMLSATELADRRGWDVKTRKTVELKGGRRVTFRLSENIRFPGMERGKHLDGFQEETDEESGDGEPLTE